VVGYTVERCYHGHVLAHKFLNIFRVRIVVVDTKYLVYNFILVFQLIVQTDWYALSVVADNVELVVVIFDWFTLIFHEIVY